MFKYLLRVVKGAPVEESGSARRDGRQSSVSPARPPEWAPGETSSQCRPGAREPVEGCLCMDLIPCTSASRHGHMGSLRQNHLAEPTPESRAVGAMGEWKAPTVGATPFADPMHNPPRPCPGQRHQHCSGLSGTGPETQPRLTPAYVGIDRFVPGGLSSGQARSSYSLSPETFIFIIHSCSQFWKNSSHDFFKYRVLPSVPFWNLSPKTLTLSLVSFN